MFHETQFQYETNTSFVLWKERNGHSILILQRHS